jgi:hypothetical protein
MEPQPYEQARYEHEKLIGTRRSRGIGVGLIALMVGGIIAGLVWLNRFESRGPVRTEHGMPGAVATTGEEPGSLDTDNSGPALSTIHELETITGATDGHELVGRTVDLHVPVQQHINDVAFWVGNRDNRLLVVLSRDNRDGAARQQGRPSSSSAGSIPSDQQITVVGTIQRVPYAEAMYSWGLTNADRSELMDRRIYLRADKVVYGPS